MRAPTPISSLLVMKARGVTKTTRDSRDRSRASLLTIFLCQCFLVALKTFCCCARCGNHTKTKANDAANNVSESLSGNTPYGPSAIRAAVRRRRKEARFETTDGRKKRRRLRADSIAFQRRRHVTGTRRFDWRLKGLRKRARSP